jgi:class 3 adenylate cyclase/tetratricopeptide (TPR) repeat protein
VNADVACPACGAHVVESDRFCAHCGASLTRQVPAGDERKLVSVLVVDLAGFTAFSESLDPEDTRRMLERYWGGVRREMERFGGTVEKYIGDAVVGVFGAPLAHEEDAERSVRAALAIRELVARPGYPDVRIAVARGLALVRGGARVETGEALIVGDVVTTATRLQQQAPRNAVLVDERTHAATRSSVLYRRLPPLRLKGKRAPLQAWRAVRLRAHKGSLDGRGRFLDRQSELALLTSLLARTREGRAVELVTVLGEPGIGKTRLVRELPLVDMDRHEVRALPYGEQAPFAPLAELLRSLVGAVELAEGVEELLADTVVDTEERSRIAAHVRRLVQADANAPPSTGEPLESFAAWRRLIEAAAIRRPLLLVFEDVHWAEDALLDFVEHLVEWSAPVPLLVLCTARPDLLRRRPTWGGGRANALTVSLGPLSGDDTATLLADVLGGTPPPDEAAALVARSGGNPLYAEQLARMVHEGAPADAVPDTLQAVIAARLDRLPPVTKRVLSDASVAGLSFASAALQAIAPRGISELDAALHELERLDLLVRRGRDGEWVFRHRLVREVAYSQLPRAARADGHEAIAGWLEQHRSDEAAELVAYHWLRAREEAIACGGQGEELGARALAALEQAGRQALALGAFVSAARLYEEALDLCSGDDARRPRLQLSYARALWNAEVAGEPAAVEAHDGLLAVGDRAGAAAASALLSEMRWYRGDREAAFRYLDEAVAQASGRPGSPEQALVLTRLARTRMLAADFDGALTSGREALALAEQLGDAELQAEALNSIGSARVRRGEEQGFSQLERAIELAAGTRAAVVAYNNLGALLAEAGRRDASDSALEQGRALAEQLGDRLHLEWFDAERIGRLARDGDWDAAIAAADEWLGSSPHPAYPTIGVRAVRALLRHARGDSAGALGDVAQMEREARAAGDPQTLIPTLVGAAFILLEEGNLKAARAHTEEAIAGCEATCDIPPLAAVDLSLVAGAVGLGDAAMAVLTRAPQTNVYRQAAVTYLTGDLERAADQLEYCGASWQAAYIRLRLAERGEADPASTLAYYRRVGADRYAARAEAAAAGRALASAQSRC